MALTSDYVASPRDHVVQFYDSDEELAAQVVPYLAGAVTAGGVAVVIATEAHREAFAARLPHPGGNIVWVDAAEAMTALLVGDRPARHRFAKVVGDLVRQAAATAAGRPVRAYGEIVALMWGAGYLTAALELEELWNELGREVGFSLYCAYPQAVVGRDGDREVLDAVCRRHSAVVGPPARPAPAGGGRFPEAVAAFLPVAQGPTGARRFVTETLQAWGRGHLADDAAVVATELAANAAVHARTPFTVTVSDRPGGAVRIAVHDGSTEPPRPRRAAALDGSGRGLGLVDALAAAWGTEPGPDGKVVWADLVS